MSKAFSGLQLADDAGFFFQGVWARMFGRFIESGRQKAGLTVEQAAILAGMDPTEWTAIEAGALLPKTRRQLESMADALDLEWALMVRIVRLCREAWGLR
jgi:transcriptional regulator with XRE-family HTH domain